MTEPQTNEEALASLNRLISAHVSSRSIERTAPKVQDRIAVWDAITRNGLVVSIIALFCVVNLFSLWFLFSVYKVDQADLAAKLIGPGDRIVNSNVLISLLGATTAQLAAISLILAKSVFKVSVDDDE